MSLNEKDIKKDVLNILCMHVLQIPIKKWEAFKVKVEGANSVTSTRHPMRGMIQLVTEYDTFQDFTIPTINFMYLCYFQDNTRYADDVITFNGDAKQVLHSVELIEHIIEKFFSDIHPLNVNCSGEFVFNEIGTGTSKATCQSSILRRRMSVFGDSSLAKPVEIIFDRANIDACVSYFNAMIVLGCEAVLISDYAEEQSTRSSKSCCLNVSFRDLLRLTGKDVFNNTLMEANHVACINNKVLVCLPE